MAIQIAYVLVGLLIVYTALGLGFAILFVVIGLPRVDHAAAGASWSFRLLILPGVAALWPLMLRRWVEASSKERP
ncbi:MAG: hypothetical protein ACKVU4_03355 [Phycisphaerales bacterium]